MSALQAYVVFIIIAVVMVQYGFAIFCLLKLAYMDLSRNYYILWNLFILIVFLIGGAVFLVYYYKHPELRIKPVPTAEIADAPETEQPQTDTAEQSGEGNKEPAEQAADSSDKE